MGSNPTPSAIGFVYIIEKNEHNPKSRRLSLVLRLLAGISATILGVPT
ncbi:hypothetical protein [Hoeflea sp.]